MVVESHIHPFHTAVPGAPLDAPGTGIDPIEQPRCQAQRPARNSFRVSARTLADVKFGLLLPHFGEHANRTTVLEGARRAEALGFDSVFTRDHVVYEPHSGIENEDITFYDVVTTMAMVAAVTDRISIGTAALIPYRHPINLARSLGTITAVAGDRLLLGLGTGRFDREFEAVGLGGIPRVEMLKETIDILRSFTANGVASHHSDIFDFADVSVAPVPSELPIWWCSGTPASARIAVDMQLGWLPGRITLDTIRLRRDTMRDRALEAGLPIPQIGVVAPTRIAASRQEALAGANVPGLLKWANDFGKWWVKPASGGFETADDLQGSLIAGAADDVIAEVESFREAGVDHLVFDLRTQFDQWMDLIAMLGEQVLPEVRSGD
jgi:alkanesulfonate monooxygenase SsuD/methylene tetrahydromethanopterin reductase-like flavin-dependent oxidoreductase (luciferase family)